MLSDYKKIFELDIARSRPFNSRTWTWRESGNYQCYTKIRTADIAIIAPTNAFSTYEP